jgi:hypothetical protein
LPLVFFNLSQHPGSRRSVYPGIPIFSFAIVDEEPRTADDRLDRIKVKDMFGSAEYNGETG